MPEPYDTASLALEAALFAVVFVFRVVVRRLSFPTMLGLLALASVIATVRGIVNGHFGWVFLIGLAATVLIVAWWSERTRARTGEQARQ